MGNDNNLLSTPPAANVPAPDWNGDDAFAFNWVDAVLRLLALGWRVALIGCALYVVSPPAKAAAATCVSPAVLTAR